MANFTDPTPPTRGIFTNRTLNLRSIRAIGYDMDYTLVHYRTDEWEHRAYEHSRGKLLALGLPLEQLEFDPGLVMRGLIIDAELGNIVKADRFGYVKQAFHGTSQLDFDAQRAIYSRTIVDLAESRWHFMNTLFSISEGCLYAQLVDLLDADRLPSGLGYLELYRLVRSTLDEAHFEGQLKAEIIADPDRFVVLDPEVPLALLDQKEAGRKLLLISNSEWAFSKAILSYAFDRYLNGNRWEKLFDLVIVEAKKPTFFTGQNPIFEIVNDEGLLRPVVGRIEEGKKYLGGHAAQVEKCLGVSGDEILYVGDHIYGDVHVSKSVLRWRTALILRELEDDIAATEAARPTLRLLEAKMAEKEELERKLCGLRLALQRTTRRYGPQPSIASDVLEEEASQTKRAIAQLDDSIKPLARDAGTLNNDRWGLLMRTGNDKSHLARQVERHADIYTSRVSNFLYATPFGYLRSLRGSLPHDRGA
ncbi:MAG: HAD-IG family 5'-nucleotidase [Deltaproteobacteria bacterium]|nr:HAD-IG family 5'-nucleotidase [Deltaproteobacteria bacterium]